MFNILHGIAGIEANGLQKGLVAQPYAPTIVHNGSADWGVADCLFLQLSEFFVVF
jgi:hypothetical protein